MKIEKSIKNRILLLNISILMLICFCCCRPIETGRIESQIAEKVAEYLIEKDSLNFFNYSKDQYLHISSERLNDNTFRTLVSLNGQTSKSSDFNVEEFNVKGFKAVVYLKNAKKHKLADVFFVPDSKSWSFLSEYYDDKVWLSQLTRIYTDENSENDIPNELDF